MKKSQDGFHSIKAPILLKRFLSNRFAFFATAALLLCVVVSPKGVFSSKIHTWNWYHFYLGAKYFDELGYTGLYEQTLVAQKQDRGPLAKISRIRDLNTYDLVKISSLEMRQSPKFTEIRWKAFKRDVAALVPHIPFSKWRRVSTEPTIFPLLYCRQ